MIACSPISTCAKNVVYISGRARKYTSNCVVSTFPCTPCFTLNCNAKSISRTFSCSSTIGLQTLLECSIVLKSFKRRLSWHSLTVQSSFNSSEPEKQQLSISLLCRDKKVRLLVPKEGMRSKIRCNVERVSWLRQASMGLMLGLLVGYSSSELVRAEAGEQNKSVEDSCDSSAAKKSHGKKVYTNYSITGIPGDGRCLFRSVAHGACLRSGKPAPSESLQRELADDLRARVADEFIKRREETEWFVEGDFDRYISQIRKPHVWGGEPELLIASHVVQMPISVYMYDKERGGLIVIAEYGQEYGKESPISVLYHGSGHYDVLQIPGKQGGNRSKL